MKLTDIKIGDVLVYKKHPKDKLFGTQIIREQKRRGFSDDAASFTHVELSSGDYHAVNIAPPKARLVDITKAHKGRVIRVMRPKVYALDKSDRNRLKAALIYNALSANQFYDWKGVIKFKIPFMFHSAREFFCSEGVSFAIQQFFPSFKARLKPYQIMPADFTDTTQLDFIDEFTIGDIK